MGFVIEDVQEGTGKTAQKGKDITVHYTGYLTDGTVFDSSVSRGQPLTITLGVGQVIRGWDEGFDGMKEGGKRKLTIPPEMGYGARAVGGVIPANSTLEVHISNIYKREPIRQRSLIAEACRGTISGFGLDGYRLAIEAVCGGLPLPTHE